GRPVTATPFHYAFHVTDLASTRRFYCDTLGCVEGRSTDAWVDFDFFGHQLSAHVHASPPQPLWTGQVDGVTVPMPHFGAIIPWDRFQALARRLEEVEVPFIVPPRIRYEGRPGEQATMFFEDPSGNAIEIKAFRNPDDVFAR
ncbi:MAG TPA: VOC family protein, partial [Gemmatimonadales bacterium]|nr:VOC family protein [Gemmatimonadales bacterium]